MPETFNVLQCLKCSTFQVQLVKKALKWQCKMCAAKQSLQKIHATGTGAECRKQVQKMNALRGQLADSCQEQPWMKDVVRLPGASGKCKALDECLHQSEPAGDIDTVHEEANDIELASGASVLLKYLKEHDEEVSQKRTSLERADVAGHVVHPKTVNDVVKRPILKWSE